MGLFGDITRKIAEMRQKSKDKKEFFDQVLRAAEDGVLTDDEMIKIQERCKELELSLDDLKGIRAKAYSAALSAAKSDGVITVAEEGELAKLQKFLQIDDSEIANSKRELVRLRLLNEIQNGNPPSVSVPNVILQKGEVAYWSEPGAILEERVVKRRYAGGSDGISFRIAKGVTYRVGAHRGHLVSETAVVPVSVGELIITSKRAIFLGDGKSFNLRLDKLLDINFYSNCVRITDDKGKPRLVKFSDTENMDVVGATLSYAINQYAGS